MDTGSTMQCFLVLVILYVSRLNYIHNTWSLSSKYYYIQVVSLLEAHIHCVLIKNISKGIVCLLQWMIIMGKKAYHEVVRKYVLILKWKSDNVLWWGWGYAFVSMGSKRLWIPFRLIDIRFAWGKPESLDYRHGRGSQKRLWDRWNVSWSLDVGTTLRWGETGYILLTAQSSWHTIKYHSFTWHG